MQYISVDSIIKRIIFDKNKNFTSEAYEDFRHSFVEEKDNIFYWHISKEGGIYCSENLDRFIKSKMSVSEEYYFTKEYADRTERLLKTTSTNNETVFFSLPIYKKESGYITAFVLNAECRYSKTRGINYGVFKIIDIENLKNYGIENAEIYIHEINNILTGILSVAGKLKSEAIAPKIKRYADDIKRAVYNITYMFSLMKRES